MWNKPTQAILDDLPRLYETDDAVDCKDKTIRLHFFIGGADWFVVEFDGQDTFFGFVNLNDPEMAEWGYFTLSELDGLNINGVEVDCDMFWTPKKFSEIEII